MRNPWTKAENLREASEGSGVIIHDLDFSFLPVGFAEDSYYYMKGLLEIRLRRGSDILILRKSTLPTENLTGDYNRYPFSGKIDADGIVIHYRGTEDSVNAAVFETFGARCSISCNPGKPGSGLTIPQTISICQGIRQV